MCVLFASLQFESRSENIAIPKIHSIFYTKALSAMVGAATQAAAPVTIFAHIFPRLPFPFQM